MSRSPLLLTGGIFVALFIFGAADVLFVESFPAASAPPATNLPSVEPADTEPIELPPPEEEPAPPLPEPVEPSPVETVPPPIPAAEPPPAGAVVKRSGNDPLMIVERLGLTSAETTQRSLLSAVVKDTSQVTTRVILIEDDRAGLLSWIESPDVKQVFIVLKESVSSLFSPAVRDLLDEMQAPEGRPPRNFLTFFDDALSEERFVFVRVRERLFEFRITPGKDDVMYTLVEALTE